MDKIGNNWDNILEEEFNKPYFEKLMEFVNSEYENYTIYPEKDNIYNALKLTKPEDVKVVILGQDPYINKGQAHGLSFSVQDGIAIPPSLRNIFREQRKDLGIIQPNCGNLTKWAEQGVLLLNATLTVREGLSNSHQGKGWGIFTDAIIKYLGQQEHIVFILWGNFAKAKRKYIDTSKNLVLEAAHPSPLSATRGFFGCEHFSKANKYLEENNINPINWQL